MGRTAEIGCKVMNGVMHHVWVALRTLGAMTCIVGCTTCGCLVQSFPCIMLCTTKQRMANGVPEMRRRRRKRRRRSVALLPLVFSALLYVQHDWISPVALFFLQLSGAFLQRDGRRAYGTPVHVHAAASCAHVSACLRECCTARCMFVRAWTYHPCACA